MQNNKKTKKIAVVLASLVFLSAFLFNISVFVKSNNSNGNTSLNSIFSQASAEDEGGSGEGGGGGTLKWSAETPCPKEGQGTYNVCNENGTGSSCSSAGSTTCDCGKNCN